MRVLSLHLGSSKGLPKQKVEALSLVANFGAIGDRHAGRDPDKAVLIAGLSTYALARNAGIGLEYGSLGENLLVDFDPNTLGKEALLQIGEVKLQLSHVCTVCDSLSVFDLRLPKVLLGKRGMYARVLVSGSIHAGDTVGVKYRHESPVI